MIKKDLKNVPPLSIRGGTGTNHYYFTDLSEGKEVKIDWLQVTFDFIPVSFIESENRYKLDKRNVLFVDLIKILNPKTKNINGDYEIYINELIVNMEARKSGRYRFDNGYVINENIELMYGGNKTSFDTYPTTLIMTGQGCRAFEMAGGDWIDLLEFININAIGYLKYGRLDIAIDDFDGTEITPYQIEPYIRKHHYKSPFRTVNYQITESHSVLNNNETLGFAITFGKRGSNQLQIYDKKLERKSNDETDRDTNVWYRYEMRFIEDKAKQVVDLYIESVKDNNMPFLEYIQNVLLGLLDILVENPNDSNYRRWKTLPAWEKFLNSFKKIDLRKRGIIDTNLDKKIKWFEESMATTILEFALMYDGNKEDFYNYFENLVKNANFKDTHLKRFNNYLNKNDKSNILMKDVIKFQNDFKAIDNNNSFKSYLIKLEEELENFIYDDEEECIYIYDKKIDILESSEITMILDNKLYIKKDDNNNFIKIKSIIINYYQIIRKEKKNV